MDQLLIKNSRFVWKAQLRNSFNKSFQEFPQFVEPKYPIAVIFVLLSKTFESFAANGVRSKSLRAQSRYFPGIDKILFA
jgi:hypothetical protein